MATERITEPKPCLKIVESDSFNPYPSLTRLAKVIIDNHTVRIIKGVFIFQVSQLVSRLFQQDASV